MLIAIFLLVGYLIVVNLLTAVLIECYDKHRAEASQLYSMEVIGLTMHYGRRKLNNSLVSSFPPLNLLSLLTAFSYFVLRLLIA